MAVVAINTNPTTEFTTSLNENRNRVVRRAVAAVIRSLEGQTLDRFDVHHDLVGGWDGADPNRAYSGLIPVIGGQARFDLGLLTFDLLAENLPTYPQGDAVVFFTPDDALHVQARNILASTPGITYDAWLNQLATAFGGGRYRVHAVDYPARNRRGGTWRNAIFGLQQ